MYYSLGPFLLHVCIVAHGLTHVLVLARFIDASMYRDTFHTIHIVIHFARIAILSANRAIGRDDIHCASANRGKNLQCCDPKRHLPYWACARACSVQELDPRCTNWSASANRDAYASATISASGNPLLLT